MENRIYPLEERATVVSAGAATDNVWLPYVETGWIWIVGNYAVEDDLNAVDAARILKEVGDYPYPVEEELGLAAAVLYDGTHGIILGEGSRLGALFTGATNGDTLLLVAHGIKLPPGVELTAEILKSVGGLL